MNGWGVGVTRQVAVKQAWGKVFCGADAKEAQPLRDLGDETFLELLEAAAAASVGVIQRVFLDAIAELRAAIGIEVFQAALDNADPRRVLDHSAWDAFGRSIGAVYAPGVPGDPGPVIQTLLGAESTTLATAPVDVDLYDGQLFQTAALEYLDTQGARLVTRTTTSTKNAIVQAVKRGFENGSGLTSSAREIANKLGLSAPLERSYDAFVAAVVDPDGEHATLTPKAKRRLIEKEYKRLIEYRSFLVGHTESWEATNFGNLTALQQAAASGAIDTVAYLLEWVTRLINVCPRCIAFDGSTREIKTGFFVSDGSGPKGVEEAERPEIHPGGYCGFRTIAREDALFAPVA